MNFYIALLRNSNPPLSSPPLPRQKGNLCVRPYLTPSPVRGVLLNSVKRHNPTGRGALCGLLLACEAVLLVDRIDAQDLAILSDHGRLENPKRRVRDVDAADDEERMRYANALLGDYIGNLRTVYSPHELAVEYLGDRYIARIASQRELVRVRTRRAFLNIEVPPHRGIGIGIGKINGRRYAYLEGGGWKRG